MLDVPEERVQRGDRERDPGHHAREERAQREREPHGVARLGNAEQAQDDDDDEHHREADEVGRHDREWDELARKTNLADEIRVLEQAARRRLRGRGEEHPGRQPAEEEEPVVAAPHLGDAPEKRENEQVDRHQDEWMQERPGEAEHGAAVLGPEIPPEEAPEELAVTDYVGVNGYGERV